MKSEYVEQLFREGFLCSQSVLAAFCESYGLDRDSALRISCGLASGVNCSEVCGAVSGAVLVIGLKYGYTNTKDVDAKKTCSSKVGEFLNIFLKRKGNIICRNILCCDISTPEGRQKALDEKLFSTVCIDMVVSAADILEELGY